MKLLELIGAVRTDNLPLILMNKDGTTAWQGTFGSFSRHENMREYINREVYRFSGDGVYGISVRLM